MQQGPFQYCCGKGNMFESDHLSDVNYKRYPTFLSCKHCIGDLLTQYSDTSTDTTLVGDDITTTSGLKIKNLFDHTLGQSGVTTADGNSDVEANIGECKLYINFLVTKFSTPAFVLEK